MSKIRSFAHSNSRLTRTVRHVAFGTISLAIVMLASLAGGQTLTGTVSNSTTGKPSAGDEVILFSLGRDVKESGRTNTDALGHFSLKLDNAQTRHLIRAIHQDVLYHRVVPAGATSVAVDVYDVAQKVSGIGVVADIMRIQAGDDKITVTRDFGVRNASNPPRIQMNQRNIEFYIPDGAHIIENSGTAIIENGPPMKSVPVAENEKNRYSFASPLRPGLTRFEVSYQLPYSGSAKLNPKSIYPLENFMVMLPKSMKFRAATSAGFKSVQFPNGPDAAVEVALNPTQGQDLAFSISGEGALPTPRRHEVQSSMPPKESAAGVAPAARSNNGGSAGLSARTGGSDLLQAYRWWILSTLAAILIVASVWVAWRQQAASRSFMRKKNGLSVPNVVQRHTGYDLTERKTLERTRGTVMAPIDSELMGQIKERLFNIEVELKNGKISRAEFEKAWTALDQMLESALKRETQDA